MAYLKKSNPIISTLTDHNDENSPKYIRQLQQFPFFKKSVAIFVSLHIQTFLVCLDLTLIGQQQQVMQLCIAPGPRALTNQIYKHQKKTFKHFRYQKSSFGNSCSLSNICVANMYYCIQTKTKYSIVVLTTSTQKSTPPSTQKSTLLCIYIDIGFFISYIDVL